MNKKRLQTDQNNPVVRAYKDAIEREKNNFHIFPHNNTWVVRKIDQTDSQHIFTNQKAAEQYVSSLATQGTAIFIHNENGTIAQRKDY